MMRATMRRGLLIATVAGVVVAATAAGLAGAQEAEDGGESEEVRTEVSGLGGYSVRGDATPLSVRVWEPVSPSASFTDPGDPHAEADAAYTRAHVSTGPDARALASSMWPGTLLGDGFGTISSQIVGESAEYPVRADARYPAGPETATDPSGGQVMHASAKGLDVVAEARSSDSPSPNTAGYGSAESRSEATVRDGVAINRVDAAVEDLKLLEGLITIDSVRTILEASSDATTGRTAGSTEMSGLTIMGTGYVIDGEGLRPVEEDEGGDALLPAPTTLPNAEELRTQAGIAVRMLGHEETIEGARAAREAGGVEIVVNTDRLRTVVDTLPLQEAISGLPENFRAELAPVLRLSPRIVYVIAAGRVRAAASPPLDLDFSLGGDQSVGGGGGLGGTDGGGAVGADAGETAATGTTGTTGTSGGLSVPDAATPGTDDATSQEEAVPPAVAAPDAAGSGSPSFEAAGSGPDGPRGLGGTIVLLGLGVAGIGSAGLRGLAGGLVGGGADCPIGSPTGAPTWS